MALAENLRSRLVGFLISGCGEGGGEGIPMAAKSGCCCCCFCCSTTLAAGCICSPGDRGGVIGPSGATSVEIATEQQPHSVSTCCCCCCGKGGYNAAMALSASAVVSPRLPILSPDEPYLYTHPGPHPPSSY